MVDGPAPENWGEYRRLILSELERISRDLELLSDKLDHFRQDEISKIKIDVAMLKVKAGAWGAIGGLMVALTAALIRILSEG